MIRTCRHSLCNAMLWGIFATASAFPVICFMVVKERYLKTMTLSCLWMNCRLWDVVFRGYAPRCVYNWPCQNTSRAPSSRRTTNLAVIMQGNHQATTCIMRIIHRHRTFTLAKSCMQVADHPPPTTHTDNLSLLSCINLNGLYRHTDPDSKTSLWSHRICNCQTRWCTVYAYGGTKWQTCTATLTKIRTEPTFALSEKNWPVLPGT